MILTGLALTRWVTARASLESYGKITELCPRFLGNCPDYIDPT